MRKYKSEVNRRKCHSAWLEYYTKMYPNAESNCPDAQFAEWQFNAGWKAAFLTANESAKLEASMEKKASDNNAMFQLLSVKLRDLKAVVNAKSYNINYVNSEFDEILEVIAQQKQ